MEKIHFVYLPFSMIINSIFYGYWLIKILKFELAIISILVINLTCFFLIFIINNLIEKKYYFSSNQISLLNVLIISWKIVQYLPLISIPFLFILFIISVIFNLDYGYGFMYIFNN